MTSIADCSYSKSLSGGPKLVLVTGHLLLLAHWCETSPALSRWLCIFKASVRGLSVLLGLWCSDLLFSGISYSVTGKEPVFEQLKRSWVRFSIPPNTLSVIFGDKFNGLNDPTNSVKAMKKDRVLKIRLQSRQVHPTMLQQYNTYAVWKKYTNINTDESTHSEMGPVWRNPIQKTVRTAQLRVLMTLHNFNT